MTMNQPQLYINADLPQLSQAAATFWLQQATKAIREHGFFSVALTGGSTPKPLYRLLSEPARYKGLDWSKVQIFIGDERVVPHDHPDSNYRMARETLLGHVPVPKENIHPMQTDGPVEQAAQDYARQLQGLLPLNESGIPVFDLVMLGIGEDGHTASLFPHTTILTEYEKWVAAVYVEKLSSWRISLTYPVLNHARAIMVLASGENKAEVVQQVMNKPDDKVFPVQAIEARGEMHWFVDAAAAKALPAGFQ